MSTTTPEATEAETNELPKEYGFSVLVTGFARLWRGIGPAIAIILINAVIQAALVFGDPVFGIDGAMIYLLAAVSGLVILFTSAVITALALEAVKGKATRSAAMARVKSNILIYSAWVIGVWVLALLGHLLFTLPGLIVLVLTPFVGIAAMDGQKNALAADLKAISGRPIRWAVTVIFTGIIGFVLYLVAAGNTFFITGSLASFLTVTVVGFVGYWVQTSWACLYRSTPVGASDAPQEDAV